MSMSIRRRLVFAVVGFTTPILALAAYLLYAQVAATVRGGFDRDLRASVRVLADLAEHDETGYELELDPRSARMLTADEPLYLEAWRPDGSVLHHSAPLGNNQLPRPTAADRSVRLETVRLADGTTVRVAKYQFVPRAEVSGKQPALGLSLARSTARMNATLGRLRMVFFGVTALLVVVSGWLVGRGVSVGLRPLHQLGREIEALDTSLVDGRVAAGNAPAELLPLAGRLNDLLQRHQEAFVRERRFTADAAHELRTPLAVLQTETEVALRQERDAVDYRAVLEGIHETTVDMTRCVDALLMIARADADRLAVQPEAVDLVALAQDCWRQESAAAAERGVSLELDCDGAAEVTTDRALMRLIVGNLLANAARHGAADSQVRAAVRPRPGVVIAVTNRAPDLSPEHVPHLFERFWRRDAARTDTAAHSGLGLALVDSVAARLGLDARAELHDDCLTISLLETKEDS